MKNSRSLTTALVLGLSVVLFAAPASAWEFTMDGTYTWLYEYRTQMGTKGFFGEYDLPGAYDGYSTLNTGAFAPYNFYLGGFHKVASTTTTGTPNSPAAGVPVIWAAAYGGQGTSLAGGESIVSGSDASWQVYYMSTNVQIRMNQALRIRGNYFIGSWNSPNYSTSSGLMVSSGALTQDSSGVQRAISPGYWRTLWLSAQLPWGEIAVGKRPSSFGMGLAWNGEDNRHSDSLSLTTFYGPFRIGMSLYPSRRGYASDDYGTASGWYNERPDKNNTRVFDMGIPTVTYRSGPIDAGFALNWVFRHRGGEGVIASPGTAAATTTTVANKMANTQYAVDYGEQYGGVYFKYNNGRFFLNAEYDFDRVVENRSYPATNNGYGTIPPTYVTHDSGAIEAGALAGPAKVTVIGAWFTGDDYRYGWAGNNRGEMRLRAVRVSSGLQSDTWSNTGVFRPYSYLMVYGYGLGSSFARDTGNGFVQDASFYGARLDYAVAANLNIFGSFAWAERFSNSGFMWGCLRPAIGNAYGPYVTSTAGAPGLGGAVPAGTTNPQPYAGQVAFTNYLTNSASSTQSALTPTIPDGALGYEIDAGFDWKLLEGMTARCTFGYWVPGNWFSYACADKGVANWGRFDQNQNTAWGTAPGKSIDPVFGMEFKLEGTF